MYHIARNVLKKGLFGKASKVFFFEMFRAQVVDMKTVMEQPLENSIGALSIYVLKI